MDPIDMNSLYAREAFTRAQAQRDLARARASANQAAPAAAQRPGGIDRQSRLYKVSQEFEAIFIKQMLNVMRETVPKDGLLDGGMAEEIFQDMLYDEYALKMARTAGFGLADQVYLQLAGVERR